MKIGSISFLGVSNTYKRNNNKNVNYTPSFKADVRMARGINLDGNDISSEQVKPLFQALVGALTAFKNVGSDNILIYLKPVFTPGSFLQKPDANIEVLGMYKDTNKAVKEINQILTKEPQRLKRFIYNVENDEKIVKAKKLIKQNPQKVSEEFKDVVFSYQARDIDEKGNTVTQKHL